MGKMTGIAVLLFLFQLSVLPQIKTPAEEVFRRVELISPWVFKDGRPMGSDPERRRKSCFDLVRLEQGCGGPQPLGYGNRIGNNLDIFATDGGGRDSRTRMIELGKYNWTDQFNIPEVEPWSELKPGEQRHIMINVSGADGAPGRNADGSYATVSGQRQTKKAKQNVAYANSPLNRQVTSTITMSGKSVRGDGFTPLHEVKLGYMYLVHVVNLRDDHYVLIRVEELVRGEKVVISYFRFPSVLVP
ncbi:MAG TPA: hypothetical protein VJ781_07700 [Pyrinomonadaceae bacterium]|nr:hypothetical protein [Pyrinomonadaceae bacterium]